MDGSRFDRFTKTFVQKVGPRLTRRQALAAGVVGLTAGGLARGSHALAAQDATPAASPEAQPGTEGSSATLFVQLFEEGTWLPHPDISDTYLLTLTGSGAQTLYFSDRPQRIVGTIDTPHFFDALGFTPTDPPNAALVVRTPDGERDTLVVELFNPVYSESFGEDTTVVVTYEARLLQAYQGEGLAEWALDQEDQALPEAFDDISLFIDDCGHINTCFLSGFGGPLAEVGLIPGGPVPLCWDAWHHQSPALPGCYPCAITPQYDYKPYSYYDAKCNEAYPRCNGNCSTSRCTLGFC
jgi:hypothetical protein